MNATRHIFNIVYAYKSENSEQCAVLKKLKIIITINSVIYISTEPQQYTCTKQRVYEHEINHYKINMRAINRTMSYIRGHC